MQPQPVPSISPAHATLKPGQAITLEAPASFGEVDWFFEHAPADASLRLSNTVGHRTTVRIPEFADISGIYFLRAVSRFDPRLSAATTLRIAAPEKATSKAPRSSGLANNTRKPHTSRPANGLGRLIGNLQGFLGISSLPCSA